uniref:non-specific serine/threonine protein kinase n=1 Tax=Aceria tosichella TaxID=561515 RepID=A0A6G1S9T9_9ACAR
MEKRQIDYVRQFLNVEKCVGRGAFGQVLATSPIQNFRFAVKCTLPVIRPQRLASELRYLRDLGGKCNVVQLHTAQLFKGSLFIVMELIDHERFSKIVPEMDHEEIVMYMRNLIIALQHVHSRNIMHRDIKPGNFLYNRQQRKYLLVDFGLATQVRRPAISGGLDPCTPKSATSMHPATPHTPTRRHLNSVASSISNVPSSMMASPRAPSAYIHRLGSNLFPDTDPAPVSAQPKVIPDSPYVNLKNMKSPAKFMNFGSPLVKSITSKRSNETNDSIQMLKKLRVSTNEEHKEPVKLTVGAYESPVTTNDGCSFASARQQMNHDNHKFSTPKIPQHPRCFCYGKPKTCASCMSRPEPNAQKSGTPGYKAPETLLRYPFQTTAIDIWSAGVIMFCLLSGHSPLFRDVDDLASLCEIITLFGSKVITDTAKLLGVRLMMSPERQGYDLRSICQKIRALKKECDPNVIIPDNAFDLLQRMLDPNPFTRITASEALQHPWLSTASP